MKNFFFSLLMVSIVLLSACKKNKADLINGEWEATELELAGNNLDPKDIGGINYTFTKDGKFEYMEAGQTEEGTYNLSEDGSKLTLNYSENNLKFEKEVMELSEDKMILSGEEHGMARKVTLTRKK